MLCKPFGDAANKNKAKNSKLKAEIESQIKKEHEAYLVNIQESTQVYCKQIREGGQEYCKKLREATDVSCSKLKDVPNVKIKGANGDSSAMNCAQTLEYLSKLTKENEAYMAQIDEEYEAYEVKMKKDDEAYMAEIKQKHELILFFLERILFCSF
jgi:adenine-specific DNA methylase